MKRILFILAFIFLALPAGASEKIMPTPTLPSVELTITTADGQAHHFSVEVANTYETRRDGLMGRTAMAADKGMIFVFEAASVQNFWMKDTLIPLDMVFVRADGVVAKVHQNAQPEDLTVINSVEPVIAALELAGGRTKELGILAGSVVTSAALPAKTAN